MTAGILILFAGYTVASYGVVLIHGYDIKFSQWVNPVNPYRFPQGKVARIPASQVFP